MMSHQSDVRFGQWQDVLAGVSCDALIFDAPYSSQTHSAATERRDEVDPTGITPGYESLSESDVRAFCEAWAGDRCRGWMVSLTDSVLAPVWRAEMGRIGRYAFAPVPCVIRGMSVRLAGDGPSSWAIYACVSRPRSLSAWGTLPGAYTGGTGEREAGGGRGKPRWLMNALVRDYSRPGDLVCDPFLGWGSTLASCAELGRCGVGAEMDAEAFAEAQRRLARPQQMELIA